MFAMKAFTSNGVVLAAKALPTAMSAGVMTIRAIGILLGDARVVVGCGHGL